MTDPSGSITPTRLTLARQRRRLTQAALARQMDVTPRTIARWEDGSVSPPPETLLRLSTALAFPVDFFFGEEIDELPVGAVSFRALSKTSAGLRDSAIASGRLVTRLSRWVDERFKLPSPDVPTLAGYEPELAADALRERWGLGSDPIPNLVHVLEAHGVRVFSLATDIREVDAFSFYRNGIPYALVNTSKTGERQRFDLAHELGHLVMHCEHQATSSREAELQAQRFASAFLMPRTDVMAQPLWYADIERIVRGKRRWRVAAMALTHRLRELGMLTEWGYRDACVLLSQAGYRRSEPYKPIVPETSQVLGKVFAALRTGGTSPQQVATDLHVTLDELNRYIFGLVTVSIEGEGVGGGTRAQLELITGERGRTRTTALICGAPGLDGTRCRRRVAKRGQRCPLHRGVSAAR